MTSTRIVTKKNSIKKFVGNSLYTNNKNIFRHLFFVYILFSKGLILSLGVCKMKQALCMCKV